MATWPHPHRQNAAHRRHGRNGRRLHHHPAPEMTPQSAPPQDTEPSGSVEAPWSGQWTNYQAPVLRPYQCPPAIA